MKSLKLKKLIAVVVAALTIATAAPTGASAAWKQNSNGWWNTEGSSWSTGWRSVDNSWYYFGSDGYMKTGWANDGGTWYYMQPSGEMKTGWVNDAGTWYYLQSSGAMKTGWVNDAGTWYYLQSSGAMKTGWVNDAGTWYYLQSSGAMKTGWINDRGTWYFANGSGAMQTGVIQVNEKTYYFAPSGAMQTGTVVINGVTYTFAASGEAIGNKIPTATKAFKILADGTVVEVSVINVPVKPVVISNGGGGGGSHHSTSDSVVDKNDITATISTLYSAKIASILKNNSILANNVSVTLGDPIVVTLLDSKLDSLQTVFTTAQNEDLSTIEARLAKAEEMMNVNSTMLNVNGVTFTNYLAQADANYLANGGNSDYFKADGSFNIIAIAEKIKNNTLTYAEFKTNLEDRIIAMCNETKNAPEVTISDSTTNTTETVTKIQKDGTSIYDTSLSIDANIKGLVSLGDVTTGTYTIYCGATYFTVKIS